MKKLFAALAAMLTLALPCVAQTPVKQASATTPLRFLLVSTTDGSTPVTGAVPTVTLAKANGTTFTAASGAITEIGNGVYQVTGNATDTAVLGPLSLHATATSALAYDREFVVVAYDPQSATNLGLTNLDAAVSTRMAAFTLPTNFSTLLIGTGTDAGKVTTSNPAAGGTAITEASIWSYSARALTDKANFTLATAEYANIAGRVWSDTVDGTITEKQAQAIKLAVLSGKFAVSYNATTRVQTTTYYRDDGVTAIAVTTTTFDTTGRSVSRTRVLSNLP